MFADILLTIRDLKLQEKKVTNEQEISYQVIDYLGKQIIGANKFINLVKAQINKNESEKQADL